MKLAPRLSLLLLLGTAAPAVAGPPYLTDDPVPTDLHHWEIYAFTAADGHGLDIDGDVGLDLNYGASDRRHSLLRCRQSRADLPATSR